MPIDYYEDLMPRNAPKPAPLVEVEATPLVPEVSLLLDQDRNKSVKLNLYTSVNNQNKSTNPQKEDQKDVPYGNHYESYNTWKAKNAQLLSDITGSSGGPETVSRYSSLKQKNGTQKDHLHNKDVHQSEEFNSNGSINKQLPCANRISNKPELECTSRNGNLVHHPMQKIDQLPLNSSICYTQTANNHHSQPYHEVMHPYHQYPSSFNQTKSCFQTASNRHFNKDMMQFPIMHFNAHHDIKRQQNVCFNKQLQTTPDNNINETNCNQGQCPCENGQCRGTSKNRVGYINSQPCELKEERCKDMKTQYEKLISPLDIAHVNNQAIIDLYHIINLQNEQIFMLQQQVKQVLKLHLQCEQSSKPNFNCQHCPCMQTNSSAFDKSSGEDAHKHNDDVKSKADKTSSNNISENIEKSKRSIGVMTSSVEKTDVSRKNVAEQHENHSFSKERQKKKRHIKPISQPFHHQSYLNHRDLGNTEERLRKTVSHRTVKKPIQIESTQVDNSFSMNEADLRISTISEQDDLSPNTSVHVDLQDYYSSSSDRDGTASSSNEDEESPEYEDEPGDPPFSWTFYDTVVGQVNKILKDTPPPVQERSKSYRPSAPQMYKLNADYEPENNWSKRVTFDGPPLEDSDHNNMLSNMKDLPKLNQPMPHQDMMNDRHGRMKDFMMYNFANGNTNLSFASLRYLDRYHRLPQQNHSKPPPEQMHHGYEMEQRANKRSTKKKTRNFEKYHDNPPSMNRKKRTNSSSKLLDIQGLKQQPKLF